MCGIVGFTYTKWVPGSDRIWSAAATLLHRGPDQQGVFQSDTFAMAATRLKIIDLHSGDQPIIAQDGRTAIAFNGEIYNNSEIRAELESLGHRFRSRSDTETVLEAFLEWDTACFSRLRGMFAVALWNESSQRLILARDRMGIKPLYIARRGKDIFFGSELKAIFVHPEIERRLNMAGLDCYLSLNYVPSPWTLVEDIEKLPPAHWLEWQSGRVRTESYWVLPFGVDNSWTLPAARDQLHHLLSQSVREHLLSDVPLGVWLSGGIDSSTILHYAAELSSKPLKTFSICFQGRTCDESAYIRRAAAHYGTDHQELDLNPEENLEAAIEEIPYYSDEPNADAGALPVWFLSKLSKQKVTVALSGEGSDELFGGYLTHRASLLASYWRRLPPHVLRPALDSIRRWPVSDEKISFEYKLKRFLEGCLMPPERAHVYWNGTFSETAKQTLIFPPLPGALDQRLAEMRQLPVNGDALAPYLWFDQRYFLPDNILNKVDRMSMAHAVEVRPPFLDHRIVEFASSLPSSLKIRGARQKFLLKKDMMKDKLPSSIIRRKKIGLDIPAHEWLRGPLKSLLVGTLHAGVSEYDWLFRRDAVESCLSQHLERRANLGYHLWGLMVLCLWMKRWRIQETSSVAAQSWMSEGATVYT